MIEIVLAATALAAAPAAPDARAAYDQRVYLLEADVKCHLLNAREHAALEGSALQARGALLRAGLRPDTIRENAAARAERASCADPQLREDAAAARSAFALWASMYRQDFPGDAHVWSAARNDPEDIMAWTLWQDLGDGFRIGLARQSGEENLLIAIPVARGAAQPRSVALAFRDPKKWGEFVDPTLGGLFSARGESLLARRAPPDALTRQIWAGGRVDADVQPPGDDGAWIYWTLPEDTLRDMAALDPRDVAVLTVEQPNNRTQAVYVEVGDLAAAIAFLRAGDPPDGPGT